MTLLPLAHAGEFHPVQLLVLAGVVLAPLAAIVLAVLVGGRDGAAEARQAPDREWGGPEDR